MSCGWSLCGSFLQFLGGGTSAERSWHEIIYFEAQIFSRKMLRNFHDFFEPLFCGSEKSRKIPAEFPDKCSSQNQKITDELLQERREKQFCNKTGDIKPVKRKKAMTPLMGKLCPEISKVSPVVLKLGTKTKNTKRVGFHGFSCCQVSSSFSCQLFCLSFSSLLLLLHILKPNNLPTGSGRLIGRKKLQKSSPFSWGLLQKLV